MCTTALDTTLPRPDKVTGVKSFPFRPHISQPKVCIGKNTYPQGHFPPVRGSVVRCLHHQPFRFPDGRNKLVDHPKVSICDFLIWLREDIGVGGTPLRSF